MQQEFIRGQHRLELRHRGNVVTIGSFDGVHLGHRQILQKVVEKAHALGVPSLVVVFEPQPHEYFSGEEAPARLTRLREKVKALFDAGVDRVLCLQFNRQLRSFAADDFVTQILVNKLGVKHLVVGDDFRFGCDRQGNFAMLCTAGTRHGFTVSDTATYERGGERISSTRIRALLEQDELALAAELLGRPFSVAGRVLYGRQLGRTIGAPTANVGLGRYRSPVQGVYAVHVQLDGAQLSGVANVGVRPTVSGGPKPLLEVHILDFDEAIYGRCINVLFCKKLRTERKFNSLEELAAQIQVDIAQGREYFAQADVC